MTTGALTPSQRTYNLIRGAAEREQDAGIKEDLVAALKLLLVADPEADAGEHVEDRVYGAPHRHRWERFAPEGRQCVVCSCVQMKVKGRWVADMRRFVARGGTVD